MKYNVFGGSCRVCGNDTHILYRDFIDYLMVEESTICFRCGWYDHWGYGYYDPDCDRELANAILSFKFRLMYE